MAQAGIPWMTVLTCPVTAGEDGVLVKAPERREYFAATIKAINECGGRDFPGRRVVFIDGGNQLSPEEWLWYEEAAGPGWHFEMTDPHGDLIGTKPSMLSLLHKVALAGATWLLYMEDDLRLSKNAITAACRYAETMPPQLAFTSFCDIKNAAPLDGVTECPGYDFEGPTGEGGHWGNQMLVIPGAALQFLESVTTLPDWGIKIPPHERSWPKDWTDIVVGRKASDIMLGISLALAPSPWLKYGVFSPSLAQHIGARSLVNPKATVYGWGRDTLTWKGEEFDALTLNLNAPEFHEVVPHWKADQKTRLQLRFRGGNARGNKAITEKKAC